MQREYPNLPTGAAKWSEIVEPAKDAYWLARREGKDETVSLLRALDTALGVVESKSHGAGEAPRQEEG